MEFPTNFSALTLSHLTGRFIRDSGMVRKSARVGYSLSHVSLLSHRPDYCSLILIFSFIYVAEGRSRWVPSIARGMRMDVAVTTAPSHQDPRQSRLPRVQAGSMNYLVLLRYCCPRPTWKYINHAIDPLVSSSGRAIRAYLYHASGVTDHFLPPSKADREI